MSRQQRLAWCKAHVNKHIGAVTRYEMELEIQKQFSLSKQEAELLFTQALERLISRIPGEFDEIDLAAEAA